MTTWYLGLSSSGHDPALAVVNAAGQVVFAEATERFLQDKRAWGITPDHVTHLERTLKACGASPETDTFVVSTTWKAAKASMDVNIHEAMLPSLDTLWIRGLQATLQANLGASLLRLGVPPERRKILRNEHHLCHAAAAAWFAPVSDGFVLVLDGEGDVGAVSAYRLENRRLKRLWRSWGPGSLGTYYAWLTFHCGFDWRLGEEWKVMGLAAYGQVIPELQKELEQLLLVDRGRLRFVDDAAIAEITTRVRPYARRHSDSVMKAADLAATGQAVYAVYADAVIAALLEKESLGHPVDLILSGGCALNSSYNGSIAHRFGVRAVHVPPCPADDGNAIGAALLAWMQDVSASEVPSSPDGSPFLGIGAGDRLHKIKHLHDSFAIEDVTGHSAEAVATEISQGKVVATFRGRAEFGPRALGNRSILADPRFADMKDRINSRIKGREEYRPFAPVIRDADCGAWFKNVQSSAYMSITLPWRHDRLQQVPAVVHADGTGRLQTVTEQTYPWMSELLNQAEQLSGQAVVLNTSFNIMGKPIVDSIEDALAVLCSTGLDAVLVEDLLVSKARA